MANDDYRPVCGKTVLIAYGGIEHMKTCFMEPGHPGVCTMRLDARLVARLAVRLMRLEPAPPNDGLTPAQLARIGLTPAERAICRIAGPPPIPS